MQLRDQVTRMEGKIDKILAVVEEKLGKHVPPENPEQNVSKKEIIDDFETLRDRLDTKSFVDFAIEFLTSNAEESYQIFRNNSNVDNKIKGTYKSKFNKQRKAISSLQIFMKDTPSKPDNLYELGIWKGNITVCVNDAVKKLKRFVAKYDMKKKTKRNNISISFMCDKENVEFFKEKLDEIQNDNEGVELNPNNDETNANSVNLTVEEQFENAFGKDVLTTEV